MPPRNVGDLVRQDTGDLRFVGGLLEHTAMNPDGPARQCDGVDLVSVGDRDCVWILRPRGDARETSGHIADVSKRCRVGELERFSAELCVGLFADGDFLLHGHQRDRAERGHRQQDERGDDLLHTRGDGAADSSSGLRRRKRAYAAVNSTPYIKMIDDT